MSRLKATEFRPGLGGQRCVSPLRLVGAWLLAAISMPKNGNRYFSQMWEDVDRTQREVDYV